MGTNDEMQVTPPSPPSRGSSISLPAAPTLHDRLSRRRPTAEHSHRSSLSATHTVPTTGSTAIPKATSSEITAWLDTVFEGRGITGVDISGPTARIIAESLLNFLHSHRSSTPFVLPHNVTCEEELSLESLTGRWYGIEMCVTRLLPSIRPPDRMYSAVALLGVLEMVLCARF
jgi:hypothetical protein